MESIGGEQCTKLKLKYEACFNEWYSEQFLKGNVTEPNKCSDLFVEYKACLMVCTNYFSR